MDVLIERVNVEVSPKWSLLGIFKIQSIHTPSQSA